MISMRSIWGLLVASALVATAHAASIILISGSKGSGSAAGGNTFVDRCAESGVVICRPLDDDGEIAAYLWNNSEGWDSNRSSSGSEYVTFLSGDGCRGTGAAQIQDRPGNNESNVYLNFPLSGAASGNATNGSDIDFTATVGQTIWAQFCYQMTQTQYDNEDDTAWIGHKIFSFTSEYSSNTDQEAFVMRDGGRKHTSVSNSNVTTEDDDWYFVDEGSYIDVQPGSAYGLCEYGAEDPVANADTCYMIEPGVWYSVLMGLTVGAEATPGNATQDGTTHIRTYMAKAGDASYTKTFDRTMLKVYNYQEDGPQGPGYSGAILWNRHECSGESCVEEGTKGADLSQKFSDLIVKIGTTAPPLPDWSEWVGEPDYLEDMNVGFWYALSGSSPDLGLSATNTINDIRHNNSTGCTQGLSKLSYAGASAMQDVGPDGLGGIAYLNAGHNHYLCNEVEAWWAGTRTWEPLTTPYAGWASAGSWQTTGVYADNSPSLGHTVNYMFWHPTLHKIVVPALEVDRSGSGEIRKVALFDPETLAWTYTGSEGSRGYLGFSAYDSTRDTLMVQGSDSGDINKFSTYVFGGADGTSGSWTHSSVKYNSAHQAAAYSPDDDVYLVLHYTNVLKIISGSSPHTTDGTPTEAGTQIATHNTSGLVYSPALGCFVAYHEGEDVYKICHTSGSVLTGTWTWTIITDAANTRTPPNGDANDVGIYGRFNLLKYGSKEMVCTFSEENNAMFCMRIA